MTNSIEIQIGYTRAIRCWKSNNLRLCSQICNDLTSQISTIELPEEGQHDPRRRLISHLKKLIWSLKIKCLTEDCHVNEVLLINEDDLESEDQIRTLKSSSTKRHTLSRQNAAGSSIGVAATGRGTNLQSVRSGLPGTTIPLDLRRTAIVTGRMASVSSRRNASGRASTSYRPLTTSLTASQTAFSRSTRPLLRYASCDMLSKMIYEYLYNIQKVTNKCPDYRQCLEYLNLVQQSLRRRQQQETGSSEKSRDNEAATQQLVVILDDNDRNENNTKHLNSFWLIAFGICYFNLGINKLALEYFRAANKADPKQLDAYLWLIKIYLRRNEPLKALKCCDEGLKDSRNAILYNWKARIQSLLYDPYAAHLSLKDSLKCCPTNIEALANVGHFSFYSDKMDQALKCFGRIYQLSLNNYGSGDASVDTLDSANSSSELLNNLALCNLYSGNLTKVVPLFQRAFLSSPNEQVTSDIWYNLSFVPLNFGFINLAMSCLNLALKNDSQNEEAMNNLGVLKFGSMINDQLHYENRQELWSRQLLNINKQQKCELKNQDEHHRKQQSLFDEAESYFSSPSVKTTKNSVDFGDSQSEEYEQENRYIGQPEMLFNMAVLKHKRGQLLASVKYCHHYLEFDQNNYSIQSLMREIKQLVSHDG